MAEAMQIQVNGLPRDCQSGSTVGDLLRELDIKTERVAVELNLEILDRKDFERPQSQGGRSGGNFELHRRRGARLRRADGKGTDRCMTIAW